MKKLVLTIGLVVASVVIVFSQETDFDKFGTNNEVINYVLKGDYQKVIDLTKDKYYKSTLIADTNWQYGVFFDQNKNPLPEKDFVYYLKRFNDMIDAPDVESAIKNPQGVIIEVRDWSMLDDHLKGTPRENEMITYSTRTYMFTKNNYTIVFNLSFINHKLDAFSFTFYRDYYKYN